MLNVSDPSPDARQIGATADELGHQLAEDADKMTVSFWGPFVTPVGGVRYIQQDPATRCRYSRGASATDRVGDGRSRLPFSQFSMSRTIPSRAANRLRPSRTYPNRRPPPPP